MSQSVALLAAGPSLPRVWCEDFFDEYEVVVAVNSAGHRFTHHWLCFFDTQVWTPLNERREGVHLPLVGIRSSTPFCKMARERGLRGEVPPLHYAECVSSEQKRRTGTDRSLFTFPNALHFCMSCFPRAHVHIYGMDYNVGASCVGGLKGDRSLKRFRNEALWVREHWEESRITVFGDAKPDLLDFLAGRREQWP